MLTKCGKFTPKKCNKGGNSIQPIPPINRGCQVGFNWFGHHVGIDVCKPILQAVVNPLIEDINKTVISPVNSLIGDLQFSVCEVENGLGYVTQWWDCVREDIGKLMQDINIINEILNMNIFAYFQGWLRAITGLPLSIVFWIAIAIVVIMLISWLGGLIALFKLFI